MESLHNQTEKAWWVCEGRADRPTVTRRQVLQGGVGIALAAWLAAQGERSAVAQTVFNPDGNRKGDIFILIFLRGGADGLSIVIPHGDDGYYRNRGTIGIAKPRKSGSANVTEASSGAAETKPDVSDTTINLNGLFGLHPALGALYPLYAEGLLAPIHAVGSQDSTRSHFEAMAAMERGLGGESPENGGRERLAGTAFGQRESREPVAVASGGMGRSAARFTPRGDSRIGAARFR